LAASWSPFFVVGKDYMQAMKEFMYISRGTVMDDEKATIDQSLQGNEPDQIKYARRWIAELKGENREKAIELMKKVADCELTSEEAIQQLGVEKT
jgi:hypothetical protein